jgi:hypothetical protein
MVPGGWTAQQQQHDSDVNELKLQQQRHARSHHMTPRHQHGPGFFSHVEDSYAHSGNINNHNEGDHHSVVTNAAASHHQAEFVHAQLGSGYRHAVPQQQQHSQQHLHQEAYYHHQQQQQQHQYQHQHQYAHPPPHQDFEQHHSNHNNNNTNSAPTYHQHPLHQQDRISGSTVDYTPLPPNRSTATATTPATRHSSNDNIHYRRPIHVRSRQHSSDENRSHVQHYPVPSIDHLPSFVAAPASGSGLADETSESAVGVRRFVTHEHDQHRTNDTHQDMIAAAANGPTRLQGETPRANIGAGISLVIDPRDPEGTCIIVVHTLFPQVRRLYTCQYHQPAGGIRPPHLRVMPLRAPGERQQQRFDPSSSTAAVEGATDIFGAFAVATKLCELDSAYVDMPNNTNSNAMVTADKSTLGCVSGTPARGDNFGSLLGRRKTGREQVARWTTYAFTKLLPAVELVIGSARAGMAFETKTNVTKVTLRSSSTELVDYRLKRFPVEVLRLDDALRKRQSLSCCGPTNESNVSQCVLTLADLAMFV